jgi:hypothetical protein
MRTLCDEGASANAHLQESIRLKGSESELRRQSNGSNGSGEQGRDGRLHSSSLRQCGAALGCLYQKEDVMQRLLDASQLAAEQGCLPLCSRERRFSVNLAFFLRSK